MLSARAATSGPMRSKGASARRDSRPGRRTGTAVQAGRVEGCRAPPPAWGKQKSRGRVGSDGVGEPGGGRGLLAEAQRQEFALLRGEVFEDGTGAGGGGGRAPALFLPPSEELFEVAGVEICA